MSVPFQNFWIRMCMQNSAYKLGFKFLQPYSSVPHISISLNYRINKNLFKCMQHRSFIFTANPFTKRPVRKKVPPSTNQPGIFNVTAISTASEYDLEELMVHIVQEGLYEEKELPPDLENAKYLTALYTIDAEPRDIVVFRQGAVVFWNIPVEEQSNFLASLRIFEQDPYEVKVVEHEAETMDYMHSKSTESNSKGKIVNNKVVLSKSTDITMEKYTHSNGLMDSVKLGIWEATLAEYIESIEDVTENLREGGQLKLSRKQVLQKTGELFNLSHLINLSSDLLDTPDFYWDRDDLERLYKQSQSYFNISNRTRVMNNKLSHCMDLVDLLRDHLNTKHEVRLEWMIIILILVEVLFEIVHVVERRQASSSVD
ncbi:hypothetical protein EB796_022054 [Bugula neritina]|uniref:DUF155 domain-containing protein n=1 Tax=Bugula neritina TaxID=10212 RepID=A0A7J7J0M4_BUGNE|nr:hypothetical protein EB796_022054 [Bugula neritina]